MTAFKFRRFSDIGEFTVVAKPFLMRDEAAHCLQLGLLAAMAVGEWRGSLFFGVGYEADEPVLIALRTAPHPLILSMCESPAAISALIAHIAGMNPDERPDAITGPAAVTDEFARQWSSKAGRIKATERERIYRLDEVTPVSNVPGEPRAATAADEDLLVAWFDAFYREALPNQPADAAATVERWLATPATRELWFWMGDSRPVSLAGAGSPTRNGIRIGPVYTPPGKRGQGYASALVANLSQRELDAGRGFCTLFTDLNNPTSNRIYTAIGYRPVTDVNKYDLIRTD